VLTCSFAGSIAHKNRANKTLARGVATAFRASQLPVPIDVPIDDSIAMTRRSRSIAAEHVRTRVGIV
jgi:hypothetical protein